MINKDGIFVLVLHGHIPYVISHGKWPHGTDWLSEAAAETYVPLLKILRELEADNIKTRITMGVSPILAEQLADPEFLEELSSYLRMKIEAAITDRKAFRASGEKHYEKLAVKWIEFYSSVLEDYEDRYDRSIISGLKEFNDKGMLELITCGATHGYFPLISSDAAINLQVKAAVETHKKHFGKSPAGIWMPECAYRPSYAWKRPVKDGYPDEAYDRPGVEEFLAEHGIKYTFIDSHLLRGGKAIGAYADRFEGLKLLVNQMKKEHKFEAHKDLSPYTLYDLESKHHKHKNVTVFTRDPKTGLQVWSGEYGYPGDGAYLDFHKKRYPGGLQYWSVTSADAGLGDKEIYDPEIIDKRLDDNASHYVELINKTLSEHKKATGEAGVLMSPFDCELFGHWWFEGVDFIKKIYEKFALGSPVVPATAAEAHKASPPKIDISIPEGSWGEGGFHYIWFNKQNEWTWRDLYRDEEKAKELVAKAHKLNDPDFTAIITQLLREMMLAHASDWQFLISTIAAADYAEMRFAHHHNSFEKIASIAERYIANGSLSSEDQFSMSELKEQDHPFQHLDINWHKDLK